MEGPRLIRTLRLRNLLSYGPDSEEVELLSLNVLIGPNASGKSNLLDAIGLLGATPRDLGEPIRHGGGIAEWLWKGAGKEPTAELDVVIETPAGVLPLRYRLGFTRVGQRLSIVEEAVRSTQAEAEGQKDAFCFYKLLDGEWAVAARVDPSVPMGGAEGREAAVMVKWHRKPEQSVLSQLKDPVRYPELTYIGERFSAIQLYREWNLGRSTPVRAAQPADLPEHFLLEDAGNLGLVLNDLEHQPGAKALILEKLKLFYEGPEDITVRIRGGTVQIFVHEKGGKLIPATRLSDGTLRYLCLLAILCHPEPPPLICLEEPELGLHPDILPTIAELLVEASRRTQLIVTTHSDVLVSALSETPEAVVVCEADDQGTHLERLDADKLKVWLEKYSLGDLWLRGQIGGTRW